MTLVISSNNINNEGANHIAKSLELIDIDNNLIWLPLRTSFEASFDFGLISIEASTTTQLSKILKSKYMLGIRNGYAI